MVIICIINYQLVTSNYYLLIWGSLPCGYYRNPGPCACIPAPSGCRLRRFPGHPRASAGIRGRMPDPAFSLSQKKRRPPRSVLFYWANSAHLSPIQNKDLAAQIGTFLLGKQCAFIPYRKLGPQILLYCWSQQYKRNGCTNSLILLRPTVYLYWRPFWPPSHQVVDPLLQWVPVALSLPRRGLQVVGPGLDLPVCSVPLPLSAQPRPWRNFVKFCVILWNLAEFWWNLAEFCEILRNFGEILWNFAEFCEI